MSEQQSKDLVNQSDSISRVRAVKDGRLPVTEATLDRAGAASPFGDDIALPLPVSQLTYVHPSPDAAPQHL